MGPDHASEPPEAISDRTAATSEAPARGPAPGSLESQRVLALQRAIGNRATTRLLSRDGPTPSLFGSTPPRYHLDPQFMPPPAGGYQLTPPFSTPPPSYLPPLPDLHDRPWHVGDPIPHADIPGLFDFRNLRLPDPPEQVTVPPATSSGSGTAPPAADDVQTTVGAQWSWTAGQRRPNRTVQLSFQRGSLVVQGSVDIDTGAVQWMAGSQSQVSTREIRVLGALVSAQAFLQILGGVTVDGGAGGQFTVQAAAGLQLTIKWGPITAQLQAGPQVAWTPRDGWSAAFNLQPGGGPTDPIPGAPGLPPMRGGLGWTFYF